jgi:hypothetical protein
VSFWERMHAELLNCKCWNTLLELANAIFKYLEIFHNRQRWHDGDRFARHWYDLAMLADHEIGAAALTNRELLEDVVRIKNALWYRSNAQYDLCLDGKCRLVPHGNLLAGLQRDYDQMITSGMFSLAPPTFDEVIAKLHRLESRINHSRSD